MISILRWFPACRLMLSAQPASFGAILCTTGTRCGLGVTIGGSSACVGPRKPAITSASTISAVSSSFGRFPPAISRQSTGAGWMVQRTSSLSSYIKPEVHALRERHQIPGLAVLQFGFGDPGAHTYLPHRLTPDRVIYTGTHDNDTTLGWWNSSATEYERRAVQSYVGRCDDGINWAFIRLVQGSVASLSVVPLQDVLGLGSEARLNTPSVHEGNYRWRYQPGSLTRHLAEKLASLAEVSDRMPQPVPIPASEEFFA